MQVLSPLASAATTGATGTSSNSTTGSSSSSTSNSSSLNQLTSESTFLQLLISQIQNQDPLNPTDSIQFVSQLCSFSQLEQLLGINQGVQTLVTDQNPTTSTSSTSPSSNSGS